MAALAGAVAGGLILQLAATPLADALRRRLAGPLGTADRVGGMVSGGLLGLLALWLLAVAALHQPALGIRRSCSARPSCRRWYGRCRRRRCYAPCSGSTGCR